MQCFNCPLGGVFSRQGEDLSPVSVPGLCLFSPALHRATPIPMQGLNNRGQNLASVVMAASEIIPRTVVFPLE